MYLKTMENANTNLGKQPSRSLLFVLMLLVSLTVVSLFLIMGLVLGLS